MIVTEDGSDMVRIERLTDATGALSPKCAIDVLQSQAQCHRSNLASITIGIIPECRLHKVGDALGSLLQNRVTSDVRQDVVGYVHVYVVRGRLRYFHDVARGLIEEHAGVCEGLSGFM